MITALRETYPTARWIRAEQAHLTLAFLGNVPRRRTEEVREAMRESARGRGPFEAAFGGVGAFPSWNKARVLWLGTARGGEELEGVAAALKVCLGRHGFKPEERQFVAHLTLARLEETRRGGSHGDPRLSRLRDAAQRWSESGEWNGSAWTVREIKLVSSALTPAGPNYSTLHRQAF